MAPHSHPRPAHVTGGPARLPWWAMALPAVAFAALLAVVATTGPTGTTDAAQPLTVLVGHLRAVLPPSLSGLL